MPLPFITGERRKLEQVIAVDLGTRSTKAVHVQRKGDVYTLFRHAILDAPIYEKVLSVEMLTEHLKAVHQAFETKHKAICISVGAHDSILRQADMPMIPVEDMRQVLKNSPKTYHPMLRGLDIPKTGQGASVGIMVTKTMAVAGEPQVTSPPGRGRGARLVAYDKRDGHELGSVLMPAGITGSPMTYSVNGRQFIIVAVSGGNYTGEYIAYALPQSELPRSGN